MEKPLLVEIVAYAPMAFYHCTHCEVAWREMGASNHMHDEQLESSLPEDLARDYQRVSEWVQALFGMYGDRILVRMVDAASVEGVYKSLKYRLHHYPAVIINGTRRFLGDGMLQLAAREVANQLGQPIQA